ncbi:MAG: hypothetical protein B6241_07590 [Spirochaetaceae bacterium 4572_59]|nr:MAG: hypothetical protein B6241_07590 [Spirochaetaceae bacterium 4572_59]
MNPRIILAPLEGMTDSVFRNCYYEHFDGLDAALAPFLPIPDKVVRVPRKVLRDVAPPGSSKVPEIPQLLVSTPESFLIAGRALEDASYEDVNWNLGCPSKGVVNKGKGAGMLPRTEDILKLLDYVLPCLSLKVSLKIRLGMYRAEESFDLVSRLKGYPLKELICHPRLGSAMYRGSPDLEGFATIAEITDIPLIYNGDILCQDDFVKLKERFPSVSGWMIGRGLIQNPFLPDLIKGKGISSVVQKERFRIFLESLYISYKKTIPIEGHRIGRIKSFLFFVIKGLEDKEILVKKIRSIHTEEEFFRFMTHLFQ